MKTARARNKNSVAQKGHVAHSGNAPERGGHQHDQWDVHGKAGAGLGPVYRGDLVGITGYG